MSWGWTTIKDAAVQIRLIEGLNQVINSDVNQGTNEGVGF